MSSPSDASNRKHDVELERLAVREERSFSNTKTARRNSLDSSSGRSSAISSRSGSLVIEDDYMAVGALRQAPKWLQLSSGESKSWMAITIERLELLSWLDGPANPHPYTIQPWLPKLQIWLLGAISAQLPGRLSLLISLAVFTVWLIGFTFIMTLAGQENAEAIEGKKPLKIECTTKLWRNATLCGLNGDICGPFTGLDFPFICPAGCASTQLLEPYIVGDEEINYHPMVVGGPLPGISNAGIYRGDSWICQAAIHAGVIQDRHGGCGILRRKGEQRNLANSTLNGISSLGFNAGFPLTFSLSETGNSCGDPQWKSFTLSFLATTVMSLSTTTSDLLFAAIFTVVFFQTALASDAPFQPDFSSMFSLAVERFLPSAFIAWFIYRYCVRHTWHQLEATLDRTVLWLGGCWIGALNKYTFDRIPISRLTPHDLKQQPGAITALIIIISLLILITLGQAWAFRNEGRLLPYLALYLGLGTTIGLLAILPGLQLRLHHYIIALLLLPGTAMQTRPSLLYQGLLIGLFINGTARWGYASVLQTAAALQGAAQLDSALPQPSVSSINASIISFSIQGMAQGFDGISVLINDVERYQESQISLPFNFDWTNPNVEDPAFFRFAYTSLEPLGGLWYGDYTKPGTWFPNGSWSDIKQSSNRS